MTPSAILFGSIGVLSETSDMQRRAYNQALAEAGVSWKWDQATYSELLEMSGGRDRLSMLGRATGQPFDEAQIVSIHARKTELACAMVREHAQLRPGVLELVELAKDQGLALGLVTSTYAANIDAILDASAGALSRSDFGVIVDREAVSEGKPAPDAYLKALRALNLRADQALAIEDTAVSIASARRAGIEVVATPGALTSDQDFHEARLVLPQLSVAGGRLDPRLLSILTGDTAAQLRAVP